MTTLAITGCMVAFTGAASANSITLSKSVGDGAGGGPPITPSVYSVSSFFTVTVFANLMAEGGGQEGVDASLFYDPTRLTAVACAEAPGGQTVSGGFYAPMTPNCGPGSPAGDGGLTTVGTVRRIEQFFTGIGVQGVSGTLILGTVTFHAKATTPGTIIASTLGGGGFLGADFINRTNPIPLGTVTVTIIPEPTTPALLGLGVLGLGLSGRRRRRR